MTKSDGYPDHRATCLSEGVAVDIYDQIYPVCGPDTDYIESLAALVDGKMRTIAAHGSTVDSLRVAVLASLNIADELVRLRRRYEDLASLFVAAESSMRTRSASLGEMLDEVLDAEQESVCGDLLLCDTVRGCKICVLGGAAQHDADV